MLNVLKRSTIVPKVGKWTNFPTSHTTKRCYSNQVLTIAQEVAILWKKARGFDFGDMESRKERVECLQKEDFFNFR